ncbi:hypothetical protein [Halobaculum roseum]|uniref:Uncharacterized protein n=1 Tax=Halobaculum roseum TaxID=2175149 RepID=A0ABD5MRG8_9EURY|nr:hypothetical protein [Halobaculum roseum]QZY01742.1 hypothetical protein K6T36_10410 [Halobaculum roseum]
MNDGTDEAIAAVERWADRTVAEATLLDGGEVGTVRRLDLADGRRVVAKAGPTTRASRPGCSGTCARRAGSACQRSTTSATACSCWSTSRTTAAPR